jgi:flagellar biosynthesis protein FlhF
MDVKTYRANSMREALQLVRQELGPEAAVLRTREVGNGWLGWMRGGPKFEVWASSKVSVPSRLQRTQVQDSSVNGNLFTPPAGAGPKEVPTISPICDTGIDLTQAGKKQPKLNATKPTAAISSDDEFTANLRARFSGNAGWPQSLERLFEELIEAEFSEPLARRLLEQVHGSFDSQEFAHAGKLRLRLAQLIERMIPVVDDAEIDSSDRRVIALVGPTGVGKTTTIAKLAANLRLRENKRVGFVTVDTYRIAAVEQLRTYADIMDLPMEVVSTPREMRSAIARMSDLDVVLLDTAGRSPYDELKVQQLRTMLAEAQADDVHLVLSSVASAESLQKTAARFLGVGVTSLVLTKLDENAGLGNLLPLFESTGLPVSYLTHGQNVPDDICKACPRELARRMLTPMRPTEISTELKVA